MEELPSKRLCSGIQSGLIMHIALQGCLKAGPIPYGLTADTGGHIRYLLELAGALSERPEITHQIIVTRAFDDPCLGTEYNRAEEQLTSKVTLWRCAGDSSKYLRKEELWRELPHLTDELIRRIQRHGIRPQLIHAHYADAGVMAMRLKMALGIPYVFTAHSLGATKAQSLPPQQTVNRTLKRRIRYEELAIKHAERLIASSEHEATLQYGLYRHHDPRKTTVNPPGCDIQSFRTAAPRSVYREVDKGIKSFLRWPDRRCLLAIARPVDKKNLTTLVRAYGQHPELRKIANLIIYAGTRENIETGEPEAREVWQQLFRLVDEYNLYGCVAYPKHHEIGHVPAIYQWAARRRGVFVNPALNEPFGLTLLEAASAGLPVVATQEGGPVDIVSRCRHGSLVKPTDVRAIGEACHQLLVNDREWERRSSNGRRKVPFYSWARHATQYVAETNLEGATSGLQTVRPVAQLLATDMDGTILGQSEGLERLARWLEKNRQCLFVVATGRSVEGARIALRAWSAPQPDFLIADVGSSIFQLDACGEARRITSWDRLLARGWNPAACRRLLRELPVLKLQPEHTQSTYKLSYFIENSGLDERKTAEPLGIVGPRHYQTSYAVVRQVKDVLKTAGLAARVVLSHGTLLDVLPVQSGKAHAVEFIRSRLNIPHREVVAAGDSGNDLDLLHYAARGIAVANHSGELESLRECKNIYWAETICATGVLEGLLSIPGNRGVET